MFCKVQLVGYLGRDAEVRNLNSGGKVANLSVATSESWKDKESGEWKERTEWHRVTTFIEGLANMLSNQGKKGRLVMIEGTLRTREYEDKEGVTRYSTEIHVERNGTIRFLDKKPEGASNDDEPSEQPKGKKAGGRGRS